MAKETIAVLLIEDSAEYADLVRIWLSDSSETEFVLNWADCLEAGLNRLKQGGIDVILLDLGLPDSAGYESFLRTRNAGVDASIILLTGEHNELLAHRMIQNGAHDYLLKSTCSGDALQKAIQYAMMRTERSETGAENLTQTIGVIGARGGWAPLPSPAAWRWN